MSVVDLGALLTAHKVGRPPESTRKQRFRERRAPPWVRRPSYRHSRLGAND
jgi:hypothetical protein